MLQVLLEISEYVKIQLEEKSEVGMMDRRSQHDFPAKRIDITGFLIHCWTEGWFDEYSNDHFLIKAIEDRVSDLECKTQMISNNSLSIFSPINENGAVDFSQFSQVFVMNISECLAIMIQFLTMELYQILPRILEFHMFTIR